MIYRVKRCKWGARPHLKAVVRWKNESGELKRRFFRTIGEAKTFAQQRETELLDQGREALNFPSEARVEALECQKLLAPFGKRLRDAATFYAAHLKQSSASCTVASAFAEYYSKKVSAGVSRNYLNHLRSIIGRGFVGSLPSERLVSEITEVECEAWIDSNPKLSNRSRNAKLKHLSAFFNWCKNRKLCAENPTREIEFRPEVDSEIGILSPEEVRALLEAADPQLLAYVAIAAFAGIRKAEIHRLDWSEIDLQDGFIEVPAAKAKTANRRLVKIQPCLDAWLRPIARQSGPVVAISDLWIRLRKLRARAGLTKWPQNALRHSFASYHLAHFKQPQELQMEMGHSGPGMLYKHYRQLVRSPDAAAYWSIFPQHPENVLPIALANTPAPASTIYRRRDPVSGKFGPLPSCATYSKTAAEYAAMYKVSQQCVCKWIRLGKPLDDAGAMEALRCGEYNKTPEQYSRIYKVPISRIKLWMAHGWPLDNQDAITRFLEHRQLVAAHGRELSRPKVLELRRSDGSASPEFQFA